VHVDGVVVPDGHDEDHSLGVRVVHRGKAALLEVVGAVVEEIGRALAEARSDRVVRRSEHLNRRVADQLPGLLV